MLDDLTEWSRFAKPSLTVLGLVFLWTWEMFFPLVLPRRNRWLHASRTVQYALFNTHCSIRTVQYALFNTHCSIRSVQYALFNTLCSIRSVQYALFNTLWALGKS
ncbi:hypothetical protein Mal48_14680 [Thalassoglobus polymorphus]|uniref:Uncharacterized protein n=1 Tax=Thalassoglobus polymorphus TaxID=2527994 RepID=A0A517QKQ5_9PLAN|nr:hypothetical protein Mal48_14680 [Thalassoglobus polymorphus]